MTIKRVAGGIVTAVILGLALWFALPTQEYSQKFEESDKSRAEMKKARSEYFFKLLRDPTANRIPQNIRSRELEHAKDLRPFDNVLSKGKSSQQSLDVSWQSAGPEGLGGRTRALAVDQRNSDVVLAGGVSGGVWKSTDSGNSWEMKTDPNQNMSVTSLAQDPTNPDTWYYASGEYLGNSASDRQYTARYLGSGIYKSTDNGESWTVIPSTKDTDVQFDSPYDYISRIKVSPSTGSVFAASNALGLYRSTDGENFSLVLGDFNDHAWIDFDIDRQGNIIAVLSSSGFSSGTNPGIFYSTDDGDSWTEVTPNSFPDGHDRSVISFAPSDPTIAYVFSQKNDQSSNPNANQGVSFFKIDVSDPQNPTAEDRSANLPDFGGPAGGVDIQGGYNMMVSVKPDDSDFVMVGATNLFRSRDGFATTPENGYSNSNDSQKDEYWIGGYNRENSYSYYKSHHPDQHVVAYDPNDPDRVWSGHDGGLSVTDDITGKPVLWQNTDEGYVTGQFYTVALPSESGDNRIMGGTQDNGTPFFRYSSSNEQQLTNSLDVSTGDGSYAFWGSDYAYVSYQLGNVKRLKIEDDGDLLSAFNGPPYPEWSDVYPANATDQLFIHPYAIDPNDDTIMYYPGGRQMWRNTKVDQIPNYNSGGTTEGWEQFTAVPSGYLISALTVTDSQPSNRLYYAGYASEQQPKLFFVDDASTSDTRVDISISSAPEGAYIHDVVVNPENGDELMAVMSNYNITGLYHSADGGDSWTAVEGNLTGNRQDAGPSIRSATILPTAASTIYLVGTSTGVYSTTSLANSNTSWSRESDDGSPGSIGYSVAEYITSRPSDGRIAVGTHGRGIFLGSTSAGGTEPITFDQTLNIDDQWQLIGSPMVVESDVTVGSNITVYGYSGRYQAASTLQPQTGYWVKSMVGSEISYNGEAQTDATISLNEGWNIIGGIQDTVAVSAIEDPNGIRSSADIFEYNVGSYDVASEIKPTRGYWIHASQAGDISLSAQSSAKPTEKKSVASSATDRIQFSSGGDTQFFFIAKDQVDEAFRNRYRMPPEAPNPALDIRTADGFRLADKKTKKLNISARSYPITVRVPEETASAFILKGITDRDTVRYQLSKGESTSVPHPHETYILDRGADSKMVTEHHLKPNYPNPFNPATNIRYQVASQANVSIEVYNVLGQKVRTLVNEQQDSGSYTVRFDGSNLSSGLYFVQLKVGATTDIQKMTLMK